MAVDDHIKVAAAELAKAASVAKTEIDQLKSQQSDVKRDKDLQIAQITQQMGKIENEVLNTGDAHSKSQARSTLTTLQRQLANHKSKSDDMIQAIEDNIRNKQDLIRSLESQSKALK